MPRMRSDRRWLQGLTEGRAGWLYAVAALTLIAGWLRFTATRFGLPDHFRPDEEYMISCALGFERDWNPHFALYPAAQMYIQHGALWAYAVLMGYRRNFRDLYGPDEQALAYLIARRVSAAMGTITVPIIYAAGAEAVGPIAGISAAAIMTFATLPVRESKYATTDAATVMWLSVAIWCLFRMIKRGRVGDYLAAGAVTGLATATKYPAGALMFGLLVAHCETLRRRGETILGGLRSARLYLMVLASALVLFLATPYVFLDLAQTISDYRYQRGFILSGSPNPQASYGWGWLWLRAMPDALSWPLVGLLTLAMLWALWRRQPGGWALLAFIVTAFVGITGSKYVFYRYVMIPLPAMVVLAGMVIEGWFRLAANRWPVRRVAVGFVVGVTAILLPGAIRDQQLNDLLRQTDSRTLAREWVSVHVPARSAIAATAVSTPYGKPQLNWGMYRLVPLTDLASLRAQHVRWIMSDSFPPLAYFSPGPTPAELAELNTQGILKVDINPLKPGAPTPVFDANDAFYAPLGRITSMNQPGPEIRIWQLK